MVRSLDGTTLLVFLLVFWDGYWMCRKSKLAGGGEVTMSVPNHQTGEEQQLNWYYVNNRISITKHIKSYFFNPSSINIVLHHPFSIFVY